MTNLTMADLDKDYIRYRTARELQYLFPPGWKEDSYLKYNTIIERYDNDLKTAKEGLAILSQIMGASFPGVSDLNSYSYVPPKNPSTEESAFLRFTYPVFVSSPGSKVEPLIIQALGADAGASSICSLEKRAAEVLGIPQHAVSSECFGYKACSGESSPFMKGKIDGHQYIERTRITKDGNKRDLGFFPSYNRFCWGGDYDTVSLPCYVGVQGLKLWGDKAAQTVCARIEEEMKIPLPPPRDQVSSGRSPVETVEKIWYGIG